MRRVISSSVLLFVVPVFCFAQGIAEIAAAAKLRGLSRADGPVLVSGDTVATSFEQALRIATPLLVQIDKRVSAIVPNGQEIWTWYQARVLENPTSKPLPGFAPPDPRVWRPPADLGPLPSDSILIHTWGGS